MPIQPENTVTPFLIPPTPQKKEELLKWAQDVNLILNAVNRQLVNTFNLHINQTYGHPKSWATWKTPRPSFVWVSSTSIKVPASASKPINLLIGGKLLQATSDLTLSINGTGPGGLDTGTKAANTDYYLYGINNAGSPGLLASVTDPNTGPTGYTDWTYLGAFATDSGAATITPFISNNGFYYADASLDSKNITGTTTQTARTFSSLPVTAKQAYGIVSSSGANVNVSSTAFGTNNSGYDGIIVQSQVANVLNYSQGFVSIFTAQTIYLQVSNVGNTTTFFLLGWVENPAEFK